MRTMKHLALAAAAAAALALAGCGGGGGGTPPAPPKPKAVSLTGVTAGYVTTAGEFTIAAGETMNHGDITFSCPAGGADCDVAVTVASDGMATATSAGGLATAANSADYDARIAASDRSGRIINLYAAASKATMDAEDAGKAAAAAKESATTNSGKLGVIATMGESKTAMENAQAVLDAKTAAGKAVTDAEAAQTAAEAAKTAAMELSDGDDKTALLATIDDAITEAKAQVTAAKAVNTGTELKNAVRAVTGTSTTNPTTPADKAKAVATVINTTLMDSDLTDDTAGIASFVHGSNVTLPTATTAAVVAKTSTLPVSKTSSAGSTWADIVGAANLMDMVISSGTNTTKTVKAVSIAGMTSLEVFGQALLPTGSNTKGKETPNFTDANNNTVVPDYMGIPGTVICGGADCKLTDGGKLAGSWYFTPQYAKAYYIANAAGTGYAAEDYAQYGYWLSTSGTVVNVFSRVRTDSGAGTLSGAEGLGNVTGKNTATYKGKAAGMSVHRTYDANDQVTKTDSGAFTADVTLTATFGDTDRALKGDVTNFDGNAVDPAWKVELGGTSDGSSKEFNSGAFVDGVARDDTGRTKTGTPNGVWSASAYGGDNDDTGTATVNEFKRPVGIIGDFNANFTDGHVAGAYATRR